MSNHLKGIFKRKKYVEKESKLVPLTDAILKKKNAKHKLKSKVFFKSRVLVKHDSIIYFPHLVQNFRWKAARVLKMLRDLSIR